jgi:putative membrane protein
MKIKLNEEEKNQISEAIKRAESLTSGEIVPVFRDRSGRYEEARWRGSIFSITIALFLLLFFERAQWNAAPFTTPFTAIMLFVAGLAGYFTFHLGPAFLQRMIIGKRAMKEQVNQAAFTAFVQKEIFRTKDRTGVLIFISEFERHVVVIGDSGIHAHVKEGEWNAIVKIIVTGLRSGNMAKGVIQAVEACGAILEKSSLPRQPDDQNELPDIISQESYEK